MKKGKSTHPPIKKDGGVTLTIKGEARLACVNPDGTLAWKTPWFHNRIVNQGFNNFVGHGLINDASASHIAFMALGTGTLPATDGTSLPGEITNTGGAVTRVSITSATVSQSTQLKMYGTFTSGSDSFFSGGTQSLQNIGLYAASTGSGLFAGMTFTPTQAVQSNQQVNATYQLSFSTQ